MYEECPVELRASKTYLMEEEVSDKVFSCRIKKYNENANDEICLLLDNAELPEISLDTEYECRIWAAEGIRICRGRILERYVNKKGKNLRFRIENGFYKNNLN